MGMRRFLSKTKMNKMIRTLSLLLLCVVFASCGERPPEGNGDGGSRAAGTAAADGASPSATAADFHYSCGSGGTFTAEDIGAQRQPTQEVLAALDDLRGTMDGAFLPENGWIEVNSSGSGVTLLAPLRDAYASATFENRGGKWEPRGWGDCVPRLQLAGRSVLRWAFTDASYPPAADAKQVEVLVTEVNCSSGRELDDLIEQSVTYREEEIYVILTAPVVSGAQTCQGTMPVKYTLTLEEPPGDRAIVDPSVYPAVEPTPRTPLP